jgi:hypothetical protein
VQYAHVGGCCRCLDLIRVIYLLGLLLSALLLC